jgi:arginyl-tRNA synthetase
MKKKLEKIIQEAVFELFEIEQANFVVEYPKDEKFGDYATNVALVLAKKVGKSPMEIAEVIKKELSSSMELSSFLNKIEIVAPGYINFYLTENYFQDKIVEINLKKEKFGNSEIGKGIKVNNEFISANPTGPLHLGNGRGGFYGDALSRILRKAGFEVTNEFYINDAGEQVLKLGHSVLKDAEAVYGGEYIDELHEKYSSIVDVREAGETAAADILENFIQKTVKEKMNISFDIWMSEKKILAKNYVERAIEILKSKNLIYEADGAQWLKTTQFGDDKDRVLIKSDEKNAYIAGDCGYLLNKIERGFGRLIMGLGADHHGYVTRLKAAALALGFSGDFRIVVAQLVRVMKDGKEVRMSKRAGNVVLIDDLIDAVGRDVTRFFFLMYSPDTHMNFDLGLAEEKSQKNPVFYVQYAHARICSVLRKAEELNIDFKNADLTKIIDEKELSLIRELNKFPELIEELAGNYEVHKIPYFTIKLADKFHSFYNACKVIDEENLDLTKARLNLISAVQIVLSEALNLVGVSAPEKM